MWAFKLWFGDLSNFPTNFKTFPRACTRALQELCQGFGWHGICNAHTPGRGKSFQKSWKVGQIEGCPVLSWICFAWKVGKSWKKLD